VSNDGYSSNCIIVPAEFLHLMVKYTLPIVHYQLANLWNRITTEIFDIFGIITLKQQKFSQSDPVLIRQFWKKLQSDPVMIRQKLASFLIRAHLCYLLSSVDRIGNFCNPNPAQDFHCVIQSIPNSAVLSKYLIPSGIYPKNALIKHLTAMLNAVWIRYDHYPVCQLDIRQVSEFATG